MQRSMSHGKVSIHPLKTCSTHALFTETEARCHAVVTEWLMWLVSCLDADRRLGRCPADKGTVCILAHVLVWAATHIVYRLDAFDNEVAKGRSPDDIHGFYSEDIASILDESVNAVLRYVDKDQGQQATVVFPLWHERLVAYFSHIFFRFSYSSPPTDARPKGRLLTSEPRPTSSDALDSISLAEFNFLVFFGVFTTKSLIL